MNPIQRSLIGDGRRDLKRALNWMPQDPRTTILDLSCLLLGGAWALAFAYAHDFPDKLERITLLQQLLTLEPDLLLNITDDHDKTALHYFCEVGNLELVTTVIERGASLDMKDSFGRLPVHYATTSGKLDLITYLLTQGVCLYEEDHARASSANLLGSQLEPVLQFLLRECIIETTSNTMMSVIAILDTKRVSKEFLEHELPYLHPDSVPVLKDVLEEYCD
jgi:ankyrin repeat protein